MFKVTCSSEPNKPIMQMSSSGVWIEIYKRINELQGGLRTKLTVSGPDRYGLAEPGVS
jgi:F/Y rich C-terminus